MPPLPQDGWRPLLLDRGSWTAELGSRNGAFSTYQQLATDGRPHRRSATQKEECNAASLGCRCVRCVGGGAWFQLGERGRQEGSGLRRQRCVRLLEDRRSRREEGA